MTYYNHTFEASARVFVRDLEAALLPKLQKNECAEVTLTQMNIEHILAIVMLRLADQREIRVKGVPIKAQISVPFTTVELQSGLMKVSAQVAVQKPVSDLFVAFEYALKEDVVNPGLLALKDDRLSYYQEKTPFHKQIALNLLGVSLRTIITDWLLEPNVALQDALSENMSKSGKKLRSHVAIQTWGVVAKLYYECV